jgi:hypothetical protein
MKNLQALHSYSFSIQRLFCLQWPFGGSLPELVGLYIEPGRMVNRGLLDHKWIQTKGAGKGMFLPRPSTGIACIYSVTLHIHVKILYTNKTTASYTSVF